MEALPAFEQMDLEARSRNMRIDTAHYQEWDATKTPKPLESALMSVPTNIVALLPPQVANTLAGALGCTPTSLATRFCVNQNWDFMEFCSGTARITQWFLHHGACGCAFDKLYGDHMDATTLAGLGMAVVLLLRIKLGGLCFMAPECSTWVWIGRRQTGRSKDNVLGNSSLKVQEGNRLNQATALLCNIAGLRGVKFIVEQPLSSLFFSTQWMKSAMQYTRAVRITTSLGGFGHALMKPTVLVGTVAWLPQLHRSQKRKSCPGKKGGAEKGRAKKGGAKAAAYTVYVSQKGRRCVTGNVNELKKSAHYPVDFVCGVVRAQLGLSPLSAHQEEKKKATCQTRAPTVKRRPAACPSSSIQKTPALSTREQPDIMGLAT